MERTTLQPPHRSMFSKTSLHTSHAADLLLYPGHLWCVHKRYVRDRGGYCHTSPPLLFRIWCWYRAQGQGHTTLGCWVTGVYLSTVAGWRLQSFTSRQWIKYDLRCKVHSKIFISNCHLILELLVIGKGQTFLNYKEQIEQLK